MAIKLCPECCNLVEIHGKKCPQCGYVFDATKDEDDNQFTEGSVVSFGSYPQSSGKPEPIRWVVLKVMDDKALLFACDILDAHCFDDYTNDYAKSSVRKWLNNDFLNKAFSSEEQERICDTDVDNSSKSTLSCDNDVSDDDYRNQYSCENTKDKVFLPSVRELTSEQYGFSVHRFTEDPKRKRRVTWYAKMNNVWRCDSWGVSDCGYYYLRSPDSHDGSYAAAVHCDGSICNHEIHHADGGMLPALWVKIK